MTRLESGKKRDLRRQPIRAAQRIFYKRPSPFPFFIALAITLGVSLRVFDGKTSILGWIFTVVWSLPAASTMVGFYGMFVARRKMKATRRIADNVRATVQDKLLVVVPTIGRHDT